MFMLIITQSMLDIFKLSCHRVAKLEAIHAHERGKYPAGHNAIPMERYARGDQGRIGQWLGVQIRPADLSWCSDPDRRCTYGADWERRTGEPVGKSGGSGRALDEPIKLQRRVTTIASASSDRNRARCFERGAELALGSTL